MDLDQWMKKPQMVKEIFPVVNGLFSKIDFDFGVQKQLLDIMFIGNYGMKNPSPFVEAIQTEYGEELTSENLTVIAAALIALYENKWTRLKNIALVDYDPIHNYLDEWSDSSSGWEKKDDTRESHRTDTLNTTETTNMTRTDNLLSTKTFNETETGSNSQTDSVYGFNSATASPSESQSGSNSNSHTGSNSTADTGTQGTSGTVADTGTTRRDQTDTDDYSGSDSRDREGVHSGNIGNLTSQKMINEEIELWKWSYINEVLDDVKEFCTLPIYLKTRCN